MKANNTHKKPFKLEDVSKKESFSVPNGYFDTLPTIIQAKAIESTKPSFVLSKGLVLKLALPALLLVFIVGYVGYKFQQNLTITDNNIESMLAEISTEELVEYLDQTDLSGEDFLELVSFDGEQIDDFSMGLDNISDEELELLIGDFDLQELENI